MSRTKMLTAVAVAALMLALVAIPSLAGGWAVLTLDEFPQDIKAGSPVTVRFMIRQHGRTPSTGLEPVLRATLSKTGQNVEVKAVELSEPGHYQASFTLPEAGTWRWTIDGFGEHPQPDLQVRQAAAGIPAPQPPVAWLWIAAGVLALLTCGVFGVLLLRRNNARPWAWSLLMIPVLAAGLLVYTTQARSQEVPAGPDPDFSSTFAYGEALFVAKGCLTCHQNTRIPARYVGMSVAVGPDLSAHPQTAEFLRVWLKDPSAVKPNTQMPDLGLSDQEIEALVNFLIDK